MFVVQCESTAAAFPAVASTARQQPGTHRCLHRTTEEGKGAPVLLLYLIKLLEKEQQAGGPAGKES